MLAQLINVVIEVREFLQCPTGLKDAGQVVELTGYSVSETADFLPLASASKLVKVLVDCANC